MIYRILSILIFLISSVHIAADDISVFKQTDYASSTFITLERLQQNSAKNSQETNWMINNKTHHYSDSFSRAYNKMQRIKRLEEAEQDYDTRIDEWHENEMNWARDTYDDEAEYCP